MNYLAPIRFALVPFHRLFPDPRTLIVLQNIVFWWVIPAAYGLVRSESRSAGVALSAAALVPLTPLFWPLAWNDFRELQLVAPFAAVGRPGGPRAFRPVGRAGDRRDARLPAGVRRRRRRRSRSCPRGGRNP